MIFEKNKAIIAAVLSAAMLGSAVLPSMAVATASAGDTTGEATYAERFLSLYDDVITNGQANGYLSKTNVAPGGFGVPYHAVETAIVEAPDYGHETTSEAMSYIVWMAAMKDNITKNSDYGEYTGDLAKAWKTMEIMIPSVQTGFWGKDSLSAQVADEDSDVTKYPTPQDSSNTGSNPIHSAFTKAYSSDKGEYLMHWLADVDDWYGYGGSGGGSTTGDFTFINTFQRGEQESCFETVPHGCLEYLEYGDKGSRGIKGIFTTEDKVAAQWSYTNAPDAEDRAIQAVYAANRWNVGDSSLTTLAGKMGDELRNNMFDKYYKKIGCQSKSSPSAGYEGAHYLMSWYTSWGGAKDGSWAWQIGCSHVHEFYQNPLAAYALLYDTGLNSAMKAEKATADYETSLARQLEFYLWLQSSNGPIAGGATNSWNGKYESYPSDVSTFYDMAYVEHPVYADPGSNHWIGNQVWAMQRLAELYYYIVTDGDASNGKIKAGGLTIEEALKTILDKWCAWAVDSIELTDDGDYTIPATLNWEGQPDTWTGTYSKSSNSSLKATIDARGNSDLGCVSSFADTLIYYAAANKVKGSDISATATDVPTKCLYVGKELLDREWKLGRDEIGLSRTETNGSLTRIFTQEVWIPDNWKGGQMPNGDEIKQGIKFIDIRSMYNTDPMIKKLQAAWEADGKPTYEQVQSGSKTGTGSVELNYHRFWHAGDILMALGAMYELYPDVTPEPTPGPTPGETLYGDVNCDGVVDVSDIILLARFSAEDPDISALSAQGKINADCAYDGILNASDVSTIARFLARLIPASEMGKQA